MPNCSLCFFFFKSCPRASHLSSQHVSSLAAACNHVIILKSGQSPRNLPVTLFFSRNPAHAPACIHRIHHPRSPASGQMFRDQKAFCVLCVIPVNAARQNTRNTESRLPGVLMSVWDVAKQAWSPWRCIAVAMVSLCAGCGSTRPATFYSAPRAAASF